MLNRLEVERLQRQHGPLPVRLGKEVDSRVSRGVGRRLGGMAERVGLMTDYLSDKKIGAIVALPVERNLVRQLIDNPVAFEEIATMLEFPSVAEEFFAKSQALFNAYAKRIRILGGRISSDSLRSEQRIKLPNRQELLLILVRAHDAMYYPSMFNDPQQGKILALLGFDLALANVYDMGDGLGPRYDRLTVKKGDDRDSPFTIDLREMGVLPVNKMYEKLPKEADHLPAGLELIFLNNDFEQATMVQCLPYTVPPKHRPWLSFVTPKENGSLLDLFDDTRKVGGKVEVLVKIGHLQLARNLLLPGEGFHVVELDRVGRPVRIDGYKTVNNTSDFNLPDFPDSYYIVIRPIEGDVDRRVRWRADQIRPMRQRNRIIGLDIVETGQSLAVNGLNASWKVIEAPLVAVRSVPMPQ